MDQKDGDTPPIQPPVQAPPEKDPKLRGVVGIQNVGNTCYANSTIQIIRAVPEFSAFIVSDELKSMIPDPTSTPGKVLLAYQDLIRPMWSAYRPAYVRPLGFLNEIRDCVRGSVYENFGRPIQNDSHEYLVYLLDKFHEALNQNAGKPQQPIAIKDSQSMAELAEDGWTQFTSQNKSTIIDNCFGMIRQSIECQKCLAQSHQWQTFNVFKVPCEGATFEEWITNEMKPDELDDYVCLKCAPERQKAKLSRHIWRLPRILFMSIRRFTPDMRKIMSPSLYEGGPLSLNDPFAPESTHLSKDWSYELRGVVDHHGSHMGGHYSSQFCHPVSDEWWWIDDESSIKMEKPRLKMSSNYMYLFRSKNTETF